MLSSKLLISILLVGLTLGLTSRRALCNDDSKVAANEDTQQDLKFEPNDDTESAEPKSASKDDSIAEANYISPQIKPDGLFLFESFDDEQRFKSQWIQSSDPKYTGKWKLASGPDNPKADLQLLLPTKARHYAIGSKLSEPFKFGADQPLVVQYEVQFRETHTCGGSYIKLLRESSTNDLNKLTDKTPYTIMFGPDKCGSEAKLHLIFQYLNPKTHEYEEKHWKQAKQVADILPIFSDQKYHLLKFVLKPNNQFNIYLDGKSVGKGNLLEDLDAPINPPKEIVDPEDSKPADWDERPQIDDPDARKPDDWDENAPKTIEDPSATKPSDWLENEPKHIPDPNAKKPDDWEEMDGDWEAPLIDNPACVSVSGCGKWQPPMIANPAYKGKWKPPKIANPNYKGKWAPRKIPNPDYFFDETPFASLDSIGAVAFELWSMTDNIAFDNLIVTSNLESADLIQLVTWQSKRSAAAANSPSLLTRGVHYLKVHPWLWAVVVLAVALPLFLFISYCCDTRKLRAEAARRKKEDESRPDDESVPSGESADTSEESLGEAEAKQDDDEEEE